MRIMRLVTAASAATLINESRECSRNLIAPPIPPLGSHCASAKTRSKPSASARSVNSRLYSKSHPIERGAEEIVHPPLRTGRNNPSVKGCSRAFCSGLTAPEVAASTPSDPRCLVRFIGAFLVFCVYFRCQTRADIRPNSATAVDGSAQAVAWAADCQQFTTWAPPSQAARKRRGPFLRWPRHEKQAVKSGNASRLSAYDTLNRSPLANSTNRPGQKSFANAGAKRALTDRSARGSLARVRGNE